MKAINFKNDNFNRIEFWAATTIFVFVVFFHITHALGNNFAFANYSDTQAPFNFHFVSRLIRYVVLYASFLLLNFSIVPSLIRKESFLKNAVLIILVFLVVGLVFGTIATHLKDFFLAENQTANYNFVYQKSFLYTAWLLLVFGFYSVIRYTSLFLLYNVAALRTKYRFLAPGTIPAFVLWLIMLFLLVAGGGTRIVNGMWGIIGLSSIVFYSYGFTYLVPKSLSKQRPFLYCSAIAVLILFISFFPVFIFGMLVIEHDDPASAISGFNSAFQLFVILPLTWVVYKRHMRGNEELVALRRELGQSNASFDFLRSQINPHFLFNALNTIYGTAIQENAERTSEGIERLGDMMRFMLQENMQEKISLAREIEYLNNYISLQKLRTDPNPNISIQTEIEQNASAIQVAPMLLIPFVENAFKHGISFREPSYIKITLEIKDRTLYFDVSNSKHQQLENDPEKDKSGIGLNNVKQRLQLLYPGKHELIVRETRKDFFIHLTLKLS